MKISFLEKKITAGHYFFSTQTLAKLTFSSIIAPPQK